MARMITGEELAHLSPLLTESFWLKCILTRTPPPPKKKLCPPTQSNFAKKCRIKTAHLGGKLPDQEQRDQIENTSQNTSIFLNRPKCDHYLKILNFQ